MNTAEPTSSSAGDLKFAERLAEAMDRAQFDGPKLAHVLMVGTSSIYRWLAGVRPRRSTLTELADALGVNYEWLSDGSGPWKSTNMRQRLFKAALWKGVDGNAITDALNIDPFKRTFTPEEAKQIAEALKIRADWLLTGDGPMEGGSEEFPVSKREDLAGWGELKLMASPDDNAPETLKAWRELMPMRRDIDGRLDDITGIGITPKTLQIRIEEYVQFCASLDQGVQSTIKKLIAEYRR